MMLAALLVGGMLSLVKFPPPGEFGPLLELVVELTRPAPVRDSAPTELPPPPDVIEELTPPLTVPEDVVEPATDLPAVEAPASGEGAEIDWDVERDRAIRAVLDALEREANYSVNPPFERARREASVRFRASLAPEAEYAWDNVEKDQLGRTILRLGDDGSCFRVLDDPSGVNRWAFETFDSQMVYCEFSLGGKQGKALPWVSVIRERYPYLRDPVEIP